MIFFHSNPWSISSARLFDSHHFSRLCLLSCLLQFLASKLLRSWSLVMFNCLRLDNCPGSGSPVFSLSIFSANVFLSRSKMIKTRNAAFIWTTVSSMCWDWFYTLNAQDLFFFACNHCPFPAQTGPCKCWWKSFYKSRSFINRVSFKRQRWIKEQGIGDSNIV